LLVVAVAVVTISVAHPRQLSAKDAASASGTSSTAAQWSVQVDKVDPGDVALAPSFQIAIYESLLDELSKREIRILGVEGANPSDLDGRVPFLVRGQTDKPDAAGAPAIQPPAPAPVIESPSSGSGSSSGGSGSVETPVTTVPLSP